MAKDLKKHLTKEDNTRMAIKHMKYCSTSYVTIEMENKTTVRYHHTLTTKGQNLELTIPNADKDAE